MNEYEQHMPCCGKRKEKRSEAAKNTCSVETSSVTSGPVSLEPLSSLTHTHTKDKKKITIIKQIIRTFADFR
jgi:hypothetical protein